MITITDDLCIPESELTYTTARSGGPGGQHVNKVSSRVTLWFNVAESPHLSDEHKRLIRARLATRINRDGVLRVVSQRHRSQAVNRDAALDRFITLLREALSQAPPRKSTATPAAVKQRRLTEKKYRSQLKQQRGKPGPWEA